VKVATLAFFFWTPLKCSRLIIFRISDFCAAVFVDADRDDKGRSDKQGKSEFREGRGTIR